MYHNQLHPFPCLHCQPHTYIRMVLFFYYYYFTTNSCRFYIIIIFFTLIDMHISMNQKANKKDGKDAHYFFLICTLIYANEGTFRRLQVQNLIERCLLHHMDRDQCVKALAEHARIQPLVTITGLHQFSSHAQIKRVINIKICFQFFGRIFALKLHYIQFALCSPKLLLI